MFNQQRPTWHSASSLFGIFVEYLPKAQRFEMMLHLAVLWLIYKVIVLPKCSRCLVEDFHVNCPPKNTFVYFLTCSFHTELNGASMLWIQIRLLCVFFFFLAFGKTVHTLCRDYCVLRREVCMASIIWKKLRKVKEVIWERYPELLFQNLNIIHFSLIKR